MTDDKKFVKYGKLLKGLIHNLNSPLMGLSGRIELLQMKYPDEKSFVQINSQLDKINKMLTTAAYLVEKDNSDSVTEFDLKNLLEHYFDFLYTDMRFKHNVEKELTFESCVVKLNPSDLVSILHDIIDHLLQHIDDESKLIVSNDKNTINVCLQLSEKKDIDLSSYPHKCDMVNINVTIS